MVVLVISLIWALFGFLVATKNLTKSNQDYYARMAFWVYLPAIVAVIALAFVLRKKIM